MQSVLTNIQGDFQCFSVSLFVKGPLPDPLLVLTNVITITSEFLQAIHQVFIRSKPATKAPFTCPDMWSAEPSVCPAAASAGVTVSDR